MNKITMTIPHSLYGPKTVNAYEKDGLAVARYSKVWKVYHAPSGSSVSGLGFATRTAAVEKLEQLLRLDMDWTVDAEALLSGPFRKNATAIRDIMK